MSIETDIDIYPKFLEEVFSALNLALQMSLTIVFVLFAFLLAYNTIYKKYQKSKVSNTDTSFRILE